MSEKQCPICYDILEEIKVAPCDDCGCEENELEHLRKNEHTYQVYEVFEGLKLTLCDFCVVDFGSYVPEYLGFPKNVMIIYEEMIFIKEIDNCPYRKLCPPLFSINYNF